MYQANTQTVEMTSFNIEGNVIDHSWYHIIKKTTPKDPIGKPDTTAIILLSDLVYWYKPIHKICEKTGQHKIYKKFKEDILQRSYAEIEKLYGFTKEQARDALIVLENLGIAERVNRTIEVNGVKVPNILYIKFNHERLSELMKNYYFNVSELKKSITLSEISDDPLGNFPQRPRKKASNTETTTEISTETATDPGGGHGFAVVFSCLENVKIDKSEKEWLSTHYDEQTVKHAIAYVSSPHVKIRESLIQAIKWACKVRPEIPTSAEESIEKNKELAKKVRLNAIVPEGCRFEVLNKYVEICFNGHSNVFVLNYSEPNFQEKFKESLKKFRIFSNE